MGVMEKTPNTTLKEKVVEKVKVTGDPKKTGKEKTGDLKEEKEKNTTSKKKMMMKDQKVKETGVMMKTGKVIGKNQKVKVTGETGKTKKKVTGRNLKVKVKVKVKAAKAAKAKEVERKEEKETMKTPSITSKKVLNTI